MADLFNNDPNKTTVQEEVLKELVGDGKKFKTVEDLAKGKKESDAFIEQLKAEQAALRADLAKVEKQAQEGVTLKAVLDKLEASRKPNSDGKSEPPVINQDELKNLVRSTLTEEAKANARQTNRTTANENLLKKFSGDAEKASQYVTTKAKELGLSKEELGTLSETSPQAFATLLGLTATSNQSSVNMPSGTVNTEALNKGTGNRDEQFYLELKGKNKKEFWSPRTQQELFKYGEKHGIEALNKILHG